MQIELIPVDQLRPAPYNPRRPLRPGDPGWEKLRRSLSEFELVQPIVWNRQSGHVVSGHQRLEILKHEGRTEAPCVVVELSPERERALNITLNNASVGSSWDGEKLADLLEELHALPDFDPTLTGFDAQQLNDLMFTPASAIDARPDESAESNDTVTATLDIPCSRWSSVRTRLDELLASEPTLRLHLTQPQGD